jgi:hypothetical protein
LLALLCLAVGCGKEAAPDAKAKDAAPPAAKAEKKAAPSAEEAAAIESARKAVAEKDPSWADKAIYEAKPDKEGGWWVTVWRVAGRDKDGKPLFTPGGHRGVRVDKSGRVTAYMIGE